MYVKHVHEEQTILKFGEILSVCIVIAYIYSTNYNFGSIFLQVFNVVESLSILIVETLVFCYHEADNLNQKKFGLFSYLTRI